MLKLDNNNIEMISGIDQGTKPLMDAYLRLTRLVVENSSIASYCGCEGSALPLRKLVSQYNWTEVLRLHLESDGVPLGKDIKREKRRRRWRQSGAGWASSSMRMA